MEYLEAKRQALRDMWEAGNFEDPHHSAEARGMAKAIIGILTLDYEELEGVLHDGK